MSTARRPLTNTELVYRAVYIDLCALYVDRKHDEAEKLAWQFYQDPHIPVILRIMCCSVLGEADDGEYLRFAQEAVEHAARGAVRYSTSVAQCSANMCRKRIRKTRWRSRC
jgi:hypothetical protein